MVIALGIWMTLNSFILGNAVRQSEEDKAKKEMRLFVDSYHHKYKIGDMK